MTFDNDSGHRFILEAIELAHESVQHGGGPFGAVVVSEGEVIGRGRNRVALSNDPTAHAEIEAIRDACAARGFFHLDDCELYTSCLPCPMCLSASYWAHIARVYYAATAEDAAAAGFQDEFIYSELAVPAEQRAMPLKQIAHREAQAVFQAWHEYDGKVAY